jgi:hypothetical protein
MARKKSAGILSMAGIPGIPKCCGEARLSREHAAAATCEIVSFAARRDPVKELSLNTGEEL